MARSSAYLITEGAAFATSEVPADVANGGQVDEVEEKAVAPSQTAGARTNQQHQPNDDNHSSSSGTSSQIRLGSSALYSGSLAGASMTSSWCCALRL